MFPVARSVRAGVSLWRRRRGETVLFRTPQSPDPRYTLVVVDGPECPRVLTGQGPAHIAGDVYLLAPGVPFNVAAFGTSTYWVFSFARHVIALCLDVRPRGLPARLLADMGSVQRFNADERRLARTVSVLELMESELNEYGELEHSALPSLVSLLLTDVARLRPVPNDLACDAAGATQLVRDVFQVIEARYRSPIGLSDVAKAVDRSAAYLTHAVRAETGRTVLQWIIERRMREAERLLIDTDRPLRSIAEAVGYDSVGYFIRQFTKRHGHPPGVWRAATPARGQPVVRDAVALPA